MSGSLEGTCEAGATWLEMRGVVKDFPGQRAVDNVDFSVKRGEIHALVGENGAGKSTLIRILAGLCSKTSGSILIDGQEVSIDGPRDAQARGLTFIHQELDLVPAFTCIENITLGMDYPRNRLGLIDWPRVKGLAKEVARQMGATFDLNLPAMRLSLAQQATLLLSKALFGKSRLIVLDEPSASLPDADVRKLFTNIRALRGQGVTFIYVTHRLEEVFEIADNVTVMRDGRKVATLPREKLDGGTLLSMIIGGGSAGIGERARWNGVEPLLLARGLSGAGFIKDVSFDLSKGELLGVTGLMGAGKSELGRLIFGAERKTAGSLRLCGDDLGELNPQRAIRAGIVLVPEDRRDGLVECWSIRKNVTLPSLPDYRWAKWGGLVNPLKETRNVNALIDTLSIRTRGSNQAVRFLSGGNQQKVAIAKWLSLSPPPKVFICDEPTRGLDIEARNETYKMLKDVARGGAGILLLSSDIEEVTRICPRTLVMREGRVVAEFKEDQHTRTNILRACYGKC